MDKLGIFGLVWYGQDWFGLVWSGMVDGYCLDVIPCKIWKSYFEKQLNYGQYMKIWFDLFGMVRFGLVWFGLVCFSLVWYMGNVQMQLHANFQAPSLKNNRVMGNLMIFGLVWFGLVWYGQDWFGLVLNGVVHG